MTFRAVSLAVFGASLLAGNAAAQGLCRSAPAPGATVGTSNLWETLTKRLEVRQNTNVKKDIAQPAFVTFTNPAEGPTTYLVGIGILSSLWSRAGSDVDALVDYQRNTATDDEQGSLKVGLTGYWRARDVVAKGHSPLIAARTNYKNNGVKNTRGWQNAIGYTHLFSGVHPFPVPNHFFPIGKGSGNRTAVLDLIYFPYVG